MQQSLNGVVDHPGHVMKRAADGAHFRALRGFLDPDVGASFVEAAAAAQLGIRKISTIRLIEVD